MIQEDITTQAFEAFIDKTAQVRVRERELAEKFHNLVEDFEGARTA